MSNSEFDRSLTLKTVQSGKLLVNPCVGFYTAVLARVNLT